MMKLMTVRDYLEGVLPADGLWFGVARMDTRRKRALCLYGSPVRVENGVKIGGVDCTGYRLKRMMLIVRGGESAAEAETLAHAVHAALTKEQVCIGGTSGFLRTLEDEPFALGADSYGVWEFRIDFELYYEL